MKKSKALLFVIVMTGVSVVWAQTPETTPGGTQPATPAEPTPGELKAVPAQPPTPDVKAPETTPGGTQPATPAEPTPGEPGAVPAKPATPAKSGDEISENNYETEFNKAGKKEEWLEKHPERAE
jgi:hypothetical protein